MMTLADYEREKILALKRARDIELRRLAVARKSSDPRYVQDFVAWCW